eukprot:g47677.t1
MAGVAASSGHRPKAQPSRPLAVTEMAAAAPRWKADASGLGDISDEFAVCSDKKDYLEGSKATIQELFKVVLVISVPLLVRYAVAGTVSPGSQQIWVQLKGRREHVRKAKEYIKGICNPEFRQIEGYPKEMHCIFAGAKGLFLKCLIQDTCADISMVSAGVIAITGGKSKDLAYFEEARRQAGTPVSELAQQMNTMLTQ